MPLIVDTYNVLHTTGVLPPELAGIGVAGLADLIADSRWGRHETALVCDGRRPEVAEPAQESIHVVQSGPRRSADDVIERMIARSSHPKRLTVVSSDLQIIKAARARRCRIIRSADFLAQLVRDHQHARKRSRVIRKPDAPLSAGEVDHWISAFGLSESDLSIPSGQRPPDKGGRQQDVDRAINRFRRRYE